MPSTPVIESDLDINNKAAKGAPFRQPLFEAARFIVSNELLGSYLQGDF